MEELWLYSLVFTFIFATLTVKKLFQKSNQNLPPSPPSLPLIGHLHLLKEPVHRSLQKLSEKYGPVYYLKFGSRPVVVVSSSSAIEECFTKNDIIFANRPRLLMGKYLAYNFNTVLTAPYGEHWRNLRRISSVEMLSQTRLSSSSGIRKDETIEMVRNLHDLSSKDYAKVELKTVFKNLMFNIVMRMLTGKRYFGDTAEYSPEAAEFTEIMTEVLEFAGAAHPGDYVAVLSWIDYGGYVRRIKRLAKKSDDFFQGLIDEHRRGSLKSEGEETMVDRLLSLQESEPEYYTDETIKGLILILLAAGTDTTAVTLEWAMSLLLNHPNVLDKAKSEIDSQVGEKLLDELDLPKLPYLQNIISETIRMFPAVPLLLPHMSSQECTIGGFNIPCGTMLLTNVWAVHRDPNLWDEPVKFKPERFDSSDPDQYKLQLLPFGLGRRSCPGASLGIRMAGLALGTLIQCFEWKRVSEKEVDLTEGKGLNMPKVQPLEAMCKARSNTSKILQFA
ncbi:hypothetical protein KSS87_023622 [Heliosperma pusillum]|nr:hypothetical protein KSS87_023622 [Heliosperma pusillum]